MFHLDMNSRVPVYEQLQERIIELYLLGLLKTNDPLPSVRSLAKDVGINPNTVQKAYQELERQNITYSLAGRGSFISENFDAHKLYLQKKKQEFFEMAQNLMQLGISKEELILLIDSGERKESI